MRKTTKLIEGGQRRYFYVFYVFSKSKKL